MENNGLEGFDETLKVIIDSSDLKEPLGREECRKRLNQYLRTVNVKNPGIDMVGHVYIDGKTLKPRVEIFNKVTRMKFIEDKLIEFRKDAEKNWEVIKVFESYQRSIELT